MDMSGLLLDYDNYDLSLDDEFGFNSSPTSDLEKELASEKEVHDKSDSCTEGLLTATNNSLAQMEEDSFYSTNPNLLHGKKSFEEMVGAQPDSQGDLSPAGSLGESWINGDLGYLLNITANDPLPPDVVDANPNEIQPFDIPHIVEVKTPIKEEVKPTCSIASSVKQRRKTVQTSRNVMEPPMLFGNEEASVDLKNLSFPTINIQDIKPVIALSNLNGTENRTRNISGASTKSVTSTIAEKSVAEKERRKRKYELQDDNDPSVKNAKAAKMNRDKKKQQMQTLQQENAILKKEIATLKQQSDDNQNSVIEIERLKNLEIEDLKRKLQEEKSKNSANSMQKVKMLDYMASIVRTITPAPNVYMSQTLAETPAPHPSELLAIRRSINEGGLASLPNGESTYLSVKVGIGGQPSITFDCESNSQQSSNSSQPFD